MQAMFSPAYATWNEVVFAVVGFGQFLNMRWRAGPERMFRRGMPANS